MRRAGALLGLLLLGLVAASPGTPAGESGPLPVSLTPSTVRAASPDLLALGQRLYEAQCAACHGPEGRGDGEAAYLLYPQPRDFTRGQVPPSSRPGSGVPTDDDLFRTISRGMPGSAMPSWGHLAEETRWALVHYVKSLVPTAVDDRPAGRPDGRGRRRHRRDPRPAGAALTTPQARARALELYADACASCHGATGQGDGAQEQKDDKGYPTRPRDLTLGVFKGSPEPEQLYRRIVAGMPGTPMPMSDWAYGDDAWHLVHLVRSLSSDDAAGAGRDAQVRDRRPPRRHRCPIIPTRGRGARRRRSTST